MAQERKKNKQQQTEAQRLAHRKAVIEHSDNKFVAELTKNMDAFIYTKDFYVALLLSVTLFTAERHIILQIK